MARVFDAQIPKVLICVHHPFDQWNAPTWFAERLRQDFPNIAVSHLNDYSCLNKEIVDADVLMAWSITPHTAALTEKLWERHYASRID